MLMEIKLIRIFLIVLYLPFLSYSQELKYSKNKNVDSLISLKIANKKRVPKFDEIEETRFTINSVKLYSTLRVLNQKLGKGVLITKKYLNNMDIDNPVSYEKKFFKIRNSLFQLDESNRFMGAEIFDSVFVLSYNKIKIGDKLDQILDKLPISKNEINLAEENYTLMLKITEVILDCKKCSTNIVFYINKKTETLQKVFFEVSEEIQD